MFIANQPSQSLHSTIKLDTALSRVGGQLTLARTAWYAIKVKSRCEFKTQDDLCLRGFPVFLPVAMVRRQWSDRVKVLEAPLFPGYLFSRFDLESRYRVLTLAGVAQIVGAGQVPIPVVESEIIALQRLIESKVLLTPWPFLHAGQKVIIGHGPLGGLEGTVIRADDGKSRVVVSVSLLQRSVSAEVERDWIESVR